VEIILRLIYEPGFQVASNLRGAEHCLDCCLARALGWVLYPVSFILPPSALGSMTWMRQCVGVGLELAFFRKPLVALDVTAITIYLLDRWLLVTIVGLQNRSPWVAAFRMLSDTLQLLRLLRPWAVGVKEGACMSFCHGWGTLLPIAMWLTSVKRKQGNMESENLTFSDDLEIQSALHSRGVPGIL